MMSLSLLVGRTVRGHRVEKTFLRALFKQSCSDTTTSKVSKILHVLCLAIGIQCNTNVIHVFCMH